MVSTCRSGVLNQEQVPASRLLILLWRAQHGVNAGAVPKSARKGWHSNVGPTEAVIGSWHQTM